MTNIQLKQNGIALSTFDKFNLREVFWDNLKKQNPTTSVHYKNDKPSTSNLEQNNDYQKLKTQTKFLSPSPSLIAKLPPPGLVKDLNVFSVNGSTKSEDLNYLGKKYNEKLNLHLYDQTPSFFNTQPLSSSKQNDLQRKSLQRMRPTLLGSLPFASGLPLPKLQHGKELDNMSNISTPDLPAFNSMQRSSNQTKSFNCDNQTTENLDEISISNATMIKRSQNKDTQRSAETIASPDNYQIDIASIPVPQSVLSPILPKTFDLKRTNNLNATDKQQLNTQKILPVRSSRQSFDEAPPIFFNFPRSNTFNASNKVSTTPIPSNLSKNTIPFLPTPYQLPVHLLSSGSMPLPSDNCRINFKTSPLSQPSASSSNLVVVNDEINKNLRSDKISNMLVTKHSLSTTQNNTSFVLNTDFTIKNNPVNVFDVPMTSSSQNGRCPVVVIIPDPDLILDFSL